ncbi:trypsin-like peptidase domain-containing protein [Nocardioides sp. SYSU DS0651]|uniref:S1C family serine protease n=1 Tax=Nocardioides sp. SYSU DS0651 TaxID=3415955 RepID=UPI003F4C40B2
MNDAYDADREPTQPIAGTGGPEPAQTDGAEPAQADSAQPAQADRAEQVPPDGAVPQWAPPGPGARPEPTVPMPASLAPSLMPPPPSAPPTAADISVRRPSERSAPPARTWPLVALIALVVGLGGGFLGALGYDELVEDPSGSGLVDGGLSDVDLEELPPLEEPGSVAAVAQAVLPSTVQIIAEYEGQEAGASGSGWVMDKNGHVVTNNHVVADAAENDGPIIVVDHDRNRHEARVVGRSPVYDLAVLIVEDPEGLVPAKLGHSRKLRVGEPVVAIGSPLSLPDTVTSGIVSYLQRPVTTGASADESSYINAIQTDAAINPGNSGGPLVNMQGEVIGVNSAIATAGGGSIDRDAGNIGVGFAIPVEQVRVTADQILKTGEAQYPVIGATVETGGIPSGEGAKLDEIMADSPAQAAGLRKGDVITHVNGARVTDGISLIVRIRSHQPDETISFTVKRGAGTREVDVTLDGKVG